ncbi:uncharacterized protein N7483_003309 [Penicillium malachiteum]|uniref:uncharacterized protein n=1 Tax=Penicillium malachiteum TaxID=1324776 RepID=UPI0025490ED2|nr:uncharacterized protein N7483_003309 [Penicillium malachiteum]KAJ5728801.1 hypothetical protein N7483_003309 [Penicillium malachiteum]
MKMAIQAVRLPLRNITGIPTRSGYPSFAARTVLQASNRQATIPTRSRPFTTFLHLHQKPTEKQKSDPNYYGSKPPETPLAMSFESIGIGKNLKLLILTMLAVSGTIEVLTYGREIWLWWKGSEGDEV